jgi:hypothetical protein
MALYEDLVVGDLTVTGSVTGTTPGSLGSLTSAQLKTALTDETGSGANVFAISPTLVTPLLGTPTSGVLTNCTGLPLAAVVKPATSVTGIRASNTALASLLTVLAAQGFIVDNTTAS